MEEKPKQREAYSGNQRTPVFMESTNETISAADIQKQDADIKRNRLKMRKEIDQTTEPFEYRWFDVVLEKELADKIEFHMPEYMLYLNWNHAPQGMIGIVRNLRNINGALVADIYTNCEIAGLYPGLCYKVLESVTSMTGTDLVRGELIYVSASGSLNIDETLDPFI